MRVGPLMMGFVPFTRRQARELADSPAPSSEDVARWHLQEEHSARKSTLTKFKASS